MADTNPKGVNQESIRTLTDDQIVTERKLPRRSFLTATGTLLAGAAALVSGVRAAAQDTGQEKKESDPDKKKESDPDKKKESKSSKTKKEKKTKEKEQDPDKAKP
jgi:hypothetical protein